MRNKIVAGNWKMNKIRGEANDLVNALKTASIPAGTQVILGVPSLYLSELSSNLQGHAIKLSAQNCHQAVSGAYTGEISAAMLAAIDVPYVILGHSERRAYFHEDNAILAAKVDAALEAGLKVIFCCGEPLEVREANGHVAFVQKQLEEGLFHLDETAFANITIAYEPIWAIGTGVTASKEQAQEMHLEIRKMVAAKYGDASKSLHILYGGSVKPSNAGEIFAQPDVDGALVGGASLKADDFTQIIQA
ncbi:MAG: triose-phosphate isomerase [Saprospiraceae bacterium]|nr:triose-phosphate isomerase [Saprospiraceae bacterium]